MEALNLKPLQILFADDDSEDIELFKLSISEIGSEVKLKIVENGTKLLKYLFEVKSSDEYPHLIFLDINMPGLNGKECLKEIRRNKKFNLIPVIIFSTSSNRNDIDETFENGANLFVTKPEDIKKQKSLLSTILKLNWNQLIQTPDKNNFLQFVPTE